jgi:5-methyltetrahydropteroyltriglutamate--homocysteine methyltransferase
VIDVKSRAVESPEIVADRIRRALEIVPADRLVINPDCGLRHVPGPVARAKLAAMAQGAAIVRQELGQERPDQTAATPTLDPSKHSREEAEP